MRGEGRRRRGAQRRGSWRAQERLRAGGRPALPAATPRTHVVRPAVAAHDPHAGLLQQVGVARDMRERGAGGRVDLAGRAGLERLLHAVARGARQRAVVLDLGGWGGVVGRGGRWCGRVRFAQSPGGLGGHIVRAAGVPSRPRLGPAACAHLVAHLEPLSQRGAQVLSAAALLHHDRRGRGERGAALLDAHLDAEAELEGAGRRGEERRR
jgi:hypothetical protein